MDTKKRLANNLPFEFDYEMYTEEELKLFSLMYEVLGSEPISDDELLTKIHEQYKDYDPTQLFMLIQDYSVISGCKFLYIKNTYVLWDDSITTVRTCGDGEDYNNERLKRLSKVVEAIPFFTSISKLHDHKGELRVTWKKEPEEDEKRIMDSLWFLFNEVQTKHITK